MTGRSLTTAVLGIFAGLLPSVLPAQLWQGSPGDIDELERQANTGDAEAMAEFAWHLIEGHGGRKFVAKDIHQWFERAAEDGSMLGKAGLSRCLVDGIGTAYDAEQAWQLVKAAAEAGHPEGLKQAGRLLFNGIGVKENRVRGLAMTREAAEKGSVAAATNLLVQRRRVEGGPVAYQAQAEHALRTGHLQAARNALYGYVFSRGDPESFETTMKVVDLVEDRARLEHPTALLALAFVRSCQGFDDEEVMLNLRAAATGVRAGLWDVMDVIARSNAPGAYPVPANFYTQPLHLRRLEWQTYRQGERDPWMVSAAAKGLLQPLDGRKPDPEMALVMLRDLLPDPKKRVHIHLAQQFVFQHRYLRKSVLPAELAVAHAVYASDKDPFAVGLIAFLLSGRQPGIEADPPRAYAAARRAGGRNWPDAKLKDMRDGLTAEQLEESERLFEAGYPSSESFVAAAAKVLSQAGELGKAQD